MGLLACYIALRFVHFAALMAVFGCTVYSVFLAPGRLGDMLALRLEKVWRPAVWLSFISAILLFGAQAGLMGDGWPDTVTPEIWRAVLGTQFGAVWCWQLMLALVALGCVMVSPPKIQALLLALTSFQIILLAGVGHATLHDGILGAIQRVNHAVHLLSAAFWAGGLIPLLACMGMAHQAVWRQEATGTMMCFSRYGHLAVAAVILSGVVNSLLIVGWVFPLGSTYFRLLLLKIFLVAVMVFLALINRYWLVPRFNRSALAQQRFIQFTWLEMLLSVAVLLIVSLFATQEPF